MNRPTPLPADPLLANKVRTVLLRWYGKNARRFPWRETTDPYRIWVSEIMLQQTQAARVVDYYLRFIARFPTVQALSKARWREVLPLWRGLGYYSRARNLLLTARVVSREYGGVFPSSDDELRALPGIGAYTASALRSFAHNVSIPAVDTNLKRIFSRIFSTEKQLSDLFKTTRGALLNHALMDLGAEICTARAPKCSVCPLRSLCPSAGKVSAPQKKKNRSTPTPRQALLLIHRKRGTETSFLTSKTHRPNRKTPSLPIFAISSQKNLRAEVRAKAFESLGVELSIRPPREIRTINGIPTAICRCQVLRGKPSGKWVEEEEIRRVLARL